MSSIRTKRMLGCGRGGCDEPVCANVPVARSGITSRIRRTAASVTIPAGGRVKLAIAFSLILCLGSNVSSAAQRPNIVLFIADDLTATDCGPYGAADVRTPNLDALARESLKFTRAFAASATCSPSRSAIYSGLYPFRNGAHANHSLVRDDLKTLPHYMKQLGYRVVLAGKTHIGPREVFPFEYLK